MICSATSSTLPSRSGPASGIRFRCRLWSIPWSIGAVIIIPADGDGRASDAARDDGLRRCAAATATAATAATSAAAVGTGNPEDAGSRDQRQRRSGRGSQGDQAGDWPRAADGESRRCRRRRRWHCRRHVSGHRRRSRRGPAAAAAAPAAAAAAGPRRWRHQGADEDQGRRAGLSGRLRSPPARRAWSSSNCWSAPTGASRMRR